MAARYLFWGAALAAALTVTLVAQQAPTGYHHASCVKVKPGRGSEFSAMVSGDLLKLAQNEINSGRLSGWVVLQAVVPAGSEAACDYVFASFFPGLPPGPMSDAEETADLEKAGVGKTLPEFEDELRSNGYLANSSIAQELTLVGGAKKGDYLVFNSMSVTNIDDWATTEEKLWKPFAEARVKEGVQAGWALNVQIFPRGAKVPSQVSSVDIYPTYADVFQEGPEFMNTWNKVHPNLKFQDAMTQIDKLCTIDSSVLYKVVEDVHASQ